MGQSRPLFVYFRPFHITNQLQIDKSIDGVLGIRTRGRRMEGADETTELWRPPASFSLFWSFLQLTVNVHYNFFPKTGFKLCSPGHGSNRSTN